MNKKQIIIFTVLLSAITLAQYRKDPISMGLGHCSSALHGGIYSVDNNPANLAFHVGREWNVFSGNLGFTNDALSISEYNDFNGANLEEGGLKSQLFDLLSSDGWNIYADFSLNTPVFSYARDNIAFTSTIVGMGKIKIPESMFHLVFEGNELTQEHDLNFQEQALLADEFAFSFGLPLRNLALGTTIKYIYGLYYLDWETSQSSFVTNETYVNSSSVFRVQQAMGGGGIGLDIGFSTYETNGWRFAASINNLLGSIRWKKEPSVLSTALSALFPNALPYNAQTIVRDYVLDIDSLNAQRFVTLELDSVIHGHNEDIDFFREFSTDYPLILRIGFSKDFPRVATFYTDVFTSFTDEFFGIDQWSVAGGMELDKIRFLPIRLGITLGGQNKIAYSTGFGFHTEMLQWDCALRLSRGFSIETMTGVEISAGLLFRPIF